MGGLRGPFKAADPDCQRFGVPAFGIARTLADRLTADRFDPIAGKVERVYSTTFAAACASFLQALDHGRHPRSGRTS